MATIIYNKLVRDRIPEICQLNGSKAVTRILNAEEYRSALYMKLQEEVDELNEAKNLDELAGVLEVVHALCLVEGFNLDALESAREAKQLKRGGFKERIFLVETQELDVRD